MKKKIVITLWISLVILIIAFIGLVYTQNQQERARLAEEARIEAEKEAQEREKEKEEEEAEALKLAEEGKAEEYTFKDMEVTYFAKDKATVRENPYDVAEILGTLSLDQRVSIVGQCNETDYYKIKINGDYGYVSPEDVSEEYIDIPLPSASGVPSATKDILFIGNSITLYPATADWWGSGWGCTASA